MNLEKVKSLDTEQIADFCERNYIRKFSIYGSILGDDFRPDSDIDVLVEFEKEAPVGLLEMAEMEIELSEMLGRKVDLQTPQDLSKYFRDKVLSKAEVLYERD